MRTCKKCGIEKSLDKFAAHECGHRYTCRECSYASRRDRFQANPDLLESNRASKRNWRKNNKEEQKRLVDAHRQKYPYKYNAASAKSNAKIRGGVPPWLSATHLAQIEWFYQAAVMMTETTGIKYEVDHIHPLNGKGFNGLHVPWNLRVIKRINNKRKGNSVQDDEIHLFWDS